MVNKHWLARSLLTCLLLVGCSEPDLRSSSQSEAKFTGDYPLQACATVGMVAEIVRNVGGEHVQVTQIMGSGVDPHMYRATRDSVQTIMNSDITFYCGLMLEGKMADTLVKVGRKKPVIAVAEQVNSSALLLRGDSQEHFDPHLWMDVAAWSKCVEVVTAALSRFDPTHEKDYRANSLAYRTQLDRLHQYGIDCIATIPPESRVLITSHDAFGYFGRAYGLQVEGVQGFSTESEAGLRRINELIELIVSRKVPAVFVESSVSSRSVQALVEGAIARGYEIRVGGQLYSDAMGELGTYEGTYIGMLDHNISVVTRMLGGTVPDSGFQGKLGSNLKELP